MIRDAIGRGDFKLPTNLMDRRRKALLSNGLEQKIIDRFLPVGERWKHETLYTEIIFSSQPRAARGSSRVQGSKVQKFKSSKTKTAPLVCGCQLNPSPTLNL